MPRVSFDEIPDHGRLWVFPIGRPLDEAEQARCLGVVDGFHFILTEVYDAWLRLRNQDCHISWSAAVKKASRGGMQG